MKEETRNFTTQLAIIGSGIAGFAASIFAVNRKIATAQIGNTGAVAYTTGYLDLLGKMDGAQAAVNDPWQALEQLRKSQSNHPLSRVAVADIHRGFNEFTAFLGECGIAYSQPEKRNITALTPVGTLKQTLCVPATMAAGPRAFAAKKPCVIIDFIGLKGFSGRQVVANLQDRWPNLGTQRIAFPDMVHGEIYPEVMARALEVPATREKLAYTLKNAAGQAKVIGLPAILGMHCPDHVRAELERLTGLEIFEIPTMPPSVPGIRLRELFEQVLPKKGVTLIPQQKVTALDFDDRGATLSLFDSYGPIRIQAQTVILATGRFLSGGLEAHPDGIREHLLDLPVTQPADRTHWYHDRYTDPRGHAIHRAGIEIDDTFRPLRLDGRPYSDRLFAAGIIIAHQDWIRGRSGAGIAIATAFRAVAEAERYLLAETNPEKRV
ncbi:MAG: glycerol-3-phosphate dehydrogenase subunit GlpB [Proteobacteria bacterium]|nr:glycerol-3-phosphate dehydrogenase subunit GlpB [Pseudomonadota bacterium]